MGAPAVAAPQIGSRPPVETSSDNESSGPAGLLVLVSRDAGAQRVGSCAAELGGKWLTNIQATFPSVRGLASNPATGKLFQSCCTTKPTGLGLSFLYDLIAQGYGGTLSVESQEGQGITFTII